MRASRALSCLVLALAFAGSARAEGVNNLLAGVNGLVTAPADPVMAAISPPEDFEDYPAVVRYPLGFLTGTLQMVHRTVMGAFDVLFFPFWVFPTLSPEARYEIMPGEIEYGY